MGKEHRIEELLEGIYNDEKYNGCVFWAPGIYFIVGDGTLWEISNDASCSPKGGWFPDIVSGPTEEEDKCMTDMMGKYDFDECFFSDIIDCYGEFDDECALEYFEEEDDGASLKIYNKIKKEIKGGKTPFETIDAFADALGRYGLESGCLYYEWEGMYIDFHDNIAETGEPRGTYECLTDDEWIDILENIDMHVE